MEKDAALQALDPDGYYCSVWDHNRRSKQIVLDIRQDKLNTDLHDWIDITGYYAHGRNPADFGLDHATLLHIAAYCGSSNAVQKLLAAGFDRTLTTGGGFYMAEREVDGNAEKVARDMGHILLADMIRDYEQPQSQHPMMAQWASFASALPHTSGKQESSHRPVAEDLTFVPGTQRNFSMSILSRFTTPPADVAALRAANLHSK